MEREITCITCPLGCRIMVTHTSGEIKNMEGHQCEKGMDYAGMEILNPVRMLTTTMMVENGDLPLVGVKTSEAIPKDMIFRVMDAISVACVEAPVVIGDILVRNVLGMNADILATRNIERKVSAGGKG